MSRAPAIRLALLLGLALAFFARTPVASAQLFSPGELAKAHEELEGISNCTKCHEAGKKLSQALCLDCHTELKGRVANKRGYHGRITDADRECEKCHLDHQGKAFKMIDWPTPSGGRNGKKEKFPHEKTGWTLEGAHKKPECKKCHDPRLIVDAAVKKLQATKRPDTQLGLSTACKACHFDEHRGQEDEKCEKCHDVEKWKPAKKFDHAKTEYPLKGKHVKVECGKCHATSVDSTTPADAFPAPVAREFMKMKGLAHEHCTDCHTDPHKGQFGRNCEQCHTVEGWNIISKNAEKTGFHDKTEFPLRGAHVSVKCEACHGPLPGMKQKFKGIAHERCDDCHYDAHLGQMSDKKLDCAKCHDVVSFDPARFELADHAKSDYPLEGGHVAVACRECHKRNDDLVKKISDKLLDLIRVRKRPKLFSMSVFRIESTEHCATCHEDVHAGQFAARVKKDGCEGCHQVASFTKVRFDHDKDSKYPLTGKHKEARCAGCHVADAKKVVRYKELDERCASCHPDAHYGQLVGPKPSEGCANCHTTEDFKKTSFDHQDARFTTFALDGKHKDAKCEACHGLVAVDGGEKTRRYKPLPRDCAGCHQDFHEGAMKRFER